MENKGTAPILITKKNCGKCDYVKKNKPDIELDIIDLETPRGMALDVQHDLKGNTLPILIYESKPYFGAVESLKKLKEIA